ncbi:hypothetical protein C8Q74DRAFT_192076 [Fomes fomentarius]|nr:hypothetical protein C8Q74DRAFT_192076 [Fomes fomentarius]
MPQTTADGRPRSATGHVLLPAFHGNDASRIPIVTTQTLGRGTVIWRIWPAVLLHTVFAAAVVSILLETNVKLGIPNVMLLSGICLLSPSRTSLFSSILRVLTIIIGVVISYCASSGYHAPQVWLHHGVPAQDTKS